MKLLNGDFKVAAEWYSRLLNFPPESLQASGSENTLKEFESRILAKRAESKERLAREKAGKLPVAELIEGAEWDYCTAIKASPSNLTAHNRYRFIHFSHCSAFFF